MTNYDQSIIDHRKRQLNALAQIRNTLPAFDRQAVSELHHKDADTLTDKDLELILTITMRNLTMVPA